jgi:hypothetical protein
MSGEMLDQAIVVGDMARRALQYVDDVVDRAVTVGDDRELVGFGASLRQGMQVNGLSLAKLLYRWWQHAAEFGIGTDDFIDHIYANLGISAQTTKKYTVMWKTIFEDARLDEGICLTLMGKPIQGLLSLTAAVREEQLDDEDWQEIANAPDAAAMSEVVRKKRGDQTSSKTRIVITWDRDGSLMARQGDDFEGIGFLKNDCETQFGSAAVDRLLTKGGVVEK